MEVDNKTCHEQYNYVIKSQPIYVHDANQWHRTVAASGKYGKNQAKLDQPALTAIRHLPDTVRFLI